MGNSKGVELIGAYLDIFLHERIIFILGMLIIERYMYPLSPRMLKPSLNQKYMHERFPLVWLHAEYGETAQFIVS